MSITFLPLISFFVSLAGITMMLLDKIFKLRNGKIVESAHSHSFFHHSHHFNLNPQSIKLALSRGARRLGYIALFITLRTSIKSLNFIKVKGKILIKEIENKFRKKSHLIDNLPEKQEVSRYLKTISEYREKIRKIKHRIKKEEGIE